MPSLSTVHSLQKYDQRRSSQQQLRLPLRPLSCIGIDTLV
jgi:hypothetical protein